MIAPVYTFTLLLWFLLNNICYAVSIQPYRAAAGSFSKPIGQPPVSASHSAAAVSSSNAIGHAPLSASHSTAAGSSSKPIGHPLSSGSHSAAASAHSSHAGSSAASQAPSASSSAGLNPAAMDCQLELPANALTAEGLSTPWKLLPPCSQAVSTQQSFAEAAVIDIDGQISIYHPLIIDAGKTPQAKPVVPNLIKGSQIALFFGFNGGTLTLVDSDGEDANMSPILKQLRCVNGLPGVQGDVFGQVSWCNTEPFWTAVNSAVADGRLQVPDLGKDDLGKQCPSTRSFEIVDQDQSDNLPTKYILLSDGSTVQFTAANQAKFGTGTTIDNASDEALIADFVDPVIGCTPFEVNSIDDPGTKVASLATQELQALVWQQEPIAIVPLNDPDTVLTSSGAQSQAKTNAFRLGVNQPLLGTGPRTDEGSGTAYCNNLVKVQPPFLASFQAKFTQQMTPDAGIGNNLFTFLANRFLQSLVNLGCKNMNVPVKCTLDGDGAATACTIGTTIGNGNGNGNTNGTFSGSAGASQTGAARVSEVRSHSSLAAFQGVSHFRRETGTGSYPRGTPWFA